MKTEEMICELRRLEEAHEDDFVGTCETNWSLMCHDVANRLEELLTTQEPRLVTESDFDGADEYGYIPVWTEEKDGDMYWECIPKVAITDPDGVGVFRYWISRPTDEQRETIPWKT